jgi:hypothetical protein
MKHATAASNVTIVIGNTVASLVCIFAVAHIEHIPRVVATTKMITVTILFGCADLKNIFMFVITAPHKRIENSNVVLKHVCITAPSNISFFFSIRGVSPSLP